MVIQRSTVVTSIRNHPVIGVGLLLFAVLAVFLSTRRPAQARGEAADTMYRCHPDEDMACTIVRQTGRALIVLTYRPSGAEIGQPWSVMINDPGGASQIVRPGTVTIVPNEVAQGKTLVDCAPPMPLPAPAGGGPLPNGAPIID